MIQAIAADTPAHSIEAERYVISAAMREPVAVDLVAELISPEDFYRPSHATVWRAVLDLRAGSAPIETTSLAAYLKRENLLDAVGGLVELVSLESAAPTAANAVYYANLIADAARLRRAEAALVESLRDLRESRGPAADRLERIEQRVFTATQERSTREAASLPEVLAKVLADMESAASGRLPGLSFGIAGLDEVTLGLNPGDLTIVAARPAAGKSTFAGNVLVKTVLGLTGPARPAALISLEMLTSDVLVNLMCLRAGVNSQSIRSGSATRDQGARVAEAGHELAAAPFTLLGSEIAGDMNVAGIRSRARRLRAEGKLDLLVVDYLQRIRGDGGFERSREQDVSQVCRDLRNLASELGVPVLAMAQLNRKVEDRNDHRPRLSDLRESGSLEQEAALVLLLHRENYYMSSEEARQKHLENAATVIVAKNRFGPAGMDVALTFDPATGRFSDALDAPPPPRVHYSRPTYDHATAATGERT